MKRGVGIRDRSGTPMVQFQELAARPFVSERIEVEESDGTVWCTQSAGCEDVDREAGIVTYRAELTPPLRPPTLYGPPAAVSVHQAADRWQHLGSIDNLRGA